MKASEFIKDKGIDKAKKHLELYGWRNTPFIIKLKRLVESHEYIESYGGLNESKRIFEMRHGVINLDGWDELKQAIADVESCQ